MMSLSDFVHNKRVAVVGGAMSILGTNLGSKIDSYDTVVRVNFHWPCPLHLDPDFRTDCTEDIGCRTDVLAVCLNLFDSKKVKRMNPELILMGTPNWMNHGFDRERMKEILEKMILKNRGLWAEKTQGRTDLDQWREPCLEHKMKAWDDFVSLLREGFMWQGFSPLPWQNCSTGGRALVEVWQNEPRELFIAGFDFCTKDWTWNASVHSYMKDAEYVMAISCDPRVELSEPTRKSFGSLKIF